MGTAIRRTIMVKQIAKRYVHTAIFKGLLVQVERCKVIVPVMVSCDFHVTTVRWTKLERAPVFPVSGVAAFLCQPKSN